MSDPEKFDGVLLNMATQLEGGVPEVGYSPGKKYRGYSQENLAKAFQAVKERNMKVQRAAREYGVPESTLRDRIKGRVALKKNRSGPPPVLGVKEENKLVEYLQLLTDFGYSFSRSDVINLATDFAVVLGKREPSDTFTHQWYYSFLSRWPGLVSKRPCGTKQQAEKATSLESLTNYYYQLQSTLKKYNLTKSPDSLFVIDELCINTDKSPPEIVSWKDAPVKWDKHIRPTAPTLTMIVCGNSTGSRLPGFFVFPGKTVSSESIEDCSPGTGATCSDDGTTNSSVFQLYLENHFLKFIERKEEAQPILLLYDGHRTHISPAMIEMYKQQHVHMFPLPPNVSQALVDITFGIFRDFVPRFNEESDDFLESGFDKSIHSSVCVVACKAYKRAVNSNILKSFFKTVGIYPFCPTEVDDRIDLSKPVLFQKRNVPVRKPKETLSVKWHSPRHQQGRKQVIKPMDDPNNQDEADFEEMESEIFGGKKKKRKKVPRSVYRYNYSNRRKSTTPRVKKPKVEDKPDRSEKTPRIKLKIRKKEKGKAKSKSKRTKRIDESTTEESSEFETESTDSEIDDMLSSDEHDIEDYDAQTRRLEFESSLREELETSRLYYEYNQKQFKLIDSPRKEPSSYEFHVVSQQSGKAAGDDMQPASSEPYAYETVMTLQVDETGNVVDTAVAQQVVEEQVVEDQVVDQKEFVGKQEVIEEQEVVEEQQTVEEEQVVEAVDEKPVKQVAQATQPSGIESVEEEIPVSETCCVCKQYHPEKAVAEGYIVEFATWGKCDFPDCEHWTHLKYCCDVKVLRRHDVFHCPCHDENK